MHFLDDTLITHFQEFKNKNIKIIWGEKKLNKHMIYFICDAEPDLVPSGHLTSFASGIKVRLLFTTVLLFSGLFFFAVASCQA